MARKALLAALLLASLIPAAPAAEVEPTPGGAGAPVVHRG